MKKIILVCLSLNYIPALAQLKLIPSGVYHYADMPVKKGADRESRAIMAGGSPQFEYLEMHTTTQQKGATANKPHALKDVEELIILTAGTMKFTIDGKSNTMAKGSIVLIPPMAMQSIENVGDGPLTYYVVGFRSKKPMDIERGTKAGGAMFINADTLTFKPSAVGGGIKYFDRPTTMCEQLEMHVTQLNKKGPSHAPHQHVETEVILMIEGKSEMVIDGKTYQAQAGDLYIANSGEMHGISNTQDSVCKYFAFKWR